MSDPQAEVDRLAEELKAAHEKMRDLVVGKTRELESVVGLCEWCGCTGGVHYTNCQGEWGRIVEGLKRDLEAEKARAAALEKRVTELEAEVKYLRMLAQPPTIHVTLGEGKRGAKD